MEIIIDFFKKPIVRRLLLLVALSFILYFVRSMITLFLLTFIFIYMINTAQKFVYRHIHNYIPINRSFIIVFIYCVIIALIVLLLALYAPQIINQTIAVTELITKSVTSILKQKTTGNDILDSVLVQVRKIDLKSYAENGGKFLVSLIGNIGTLSFDFFLSIILSMFFMLQKGRIHAFMRNFHTSKVSWLYEEMAFFGTKFTNTFGKVMQTQILISFINCIFSIVMLWIMRFPSVLGLGVMVFLLGLIPVAGVFISLVPLSIIAYTVGSSMSGAAGGSTGGLRYIVYVVIMIAILHALESYVLNPKLMSDKTNLPVFFTFLILTVSSHFFGVWGLLVGIPVFVFFLDILDVKTPDMKFPMPPASRMQSNLKNNMPKPNDGKGGKGRQ